MKTRILILIAILFSVYSCSEPKTSIEADKIEPQKQEVKSSQIDGQPISRENLNDSNSDKVLAYFNALETSDGSFFRLNVNKKNHIQHNPNYENGNAGYKSLVKESKYALPNIDVYRLGVYENNVVAHSVLKSESQSYTCIDVFKFEDGFISEHYFARQELVQPSGMEDISYSGSTKYYSDSDDQLRLKVAANFVRFSRIEGEQNRNKVMISDNYREHNPYLHKSPNPVDSYYYDLKKAGVEIKYDDLINAVGGGNYVTVICTGTRNGEPVEIFDLFRFNGQKIVEHWDVVQAL